MKKLLYILFFVSLTATAQTSGYLGSGNSQANTRTDTVFFVGKFIDFVGNSITLGTGASDNAHRWTSLFTAAKGGTENNLGVSGEILQNAAACSRTVFDKTTIPTYTTSRSILFISLGINDIGVNIAALTPAGYQLKLDSVVDYAITTKSWPSARIILVTPSWITNYSFAVGCSGAVAGDVTRHEQYNAAVAAVAVARSATFADIYTRMKNNPFNATFLADGLHPNNTGHQYFSDFFNTTNFYR